MASNASNLMSDIPKIVITEPSPAPVENAAVRVPTSILPQQPQATTAPSATDEVQPVQATEVVGVGATEPASDVAGGETMPVPDSAVLDASGGFHPVQDGTECTVRVGVDSSVPNVETEATDNESSDGELGRRSCWDITVEYCRKLEGARQNSKYIFLMQILFLIIPVSAGYMGGVYMDKCPMSSSTPFFLFMMGVTGIIIILCRMLMLLQNIFVPDRNNSSVLSTICIFGNVVIVILLCTEMMAFMRKSPSFHKTDSNYCNETFYTYTYWMNWCGLFFIILMIALCAPKNCVKTSEAQPV